MVGATQNADVSCCDETQPRVGARHQDPSRGAVIIEFMVALPFLLLLAFSVYDIGRILNQYLLLTHAVSAGARYAAGIQGLTPALSETSACPSGGTTPDTTHGEVQKRVQELVSLQNVALQNNFCIRSSRTTTGTSPILGIAANEFVTVQVRGAYDSILPFMKGLPIQVTATAPYLLAGPTAAFARTGG